MNENHRQMKWINGRSKWKCCIPVPPQAEKHHPVLVKVLCSELGVDPDALLDFELCLADTQPGVSLQQVNLLFSEITPSLMIIERNLSNYLCSFVFSFLSSCLGFGRSVRGVHLLSSSGQPSQLLLRPAGHTPLPHVHTLMMLSNTSISTFQFICCRLTDLNPRVAPCKYVSSFHTPSLTFSLSVCVFSFSGADAVLLCWVSGQRAQHPHDHSIRQRGGECSQRPIKEGKLNQCGRSA